ncbi:uncharacterized protein AMSG_11885 [Thecamonas trahens ATCC 50062]|uniref:Thiamin pyrophosphokinase thiamin-binding domain-containing protein n=1 Tax=Thecamonas trahens ATCC 50062 TaxID=461836 RepID=A0A0L0DAY5_THETB|nr:hypothetical protein AMSG_11885 [Thecamonas trahens ATCC 50062]KNC49514.1 hypothetical protein AMSG_11885 [Thecamonas trahens ATCC 50062]|eukprot:XP_013757759.1 hypothetical protein AMSG_11885 [Thecamonas trahens ATCC 50062]
MERVRKITIGLGSPPMSARVHMEAVDDNAVRVMASLCPYLTAIELHGCDGVTNAGLLALAHGAEMLERVSLPSGRNITAKGLAALAACRSLKEVRISWAEHLGDDALEALAECTSLTTISLDACTGVGDAGVAALASGCGSALTSITLSGCDQVADGGLQALADGCPRVTSAGIIALADSCPQLTAVDVSDCERVGDEALAALAIGCPRLETLRVAMCPSVSAAGLRKVVDGCSALRVLDVTDCARIDDEALAVLGGCRALAHLDLSRCTQITGSGLAALAHGSAALAKISLEGCTQVCDAVLDVVARSLPSVTALDLTDCHQVTDNGVEALASGCPGLVDVNLTACAKVTDQGIISVADGCSGLERISFLQCPLVTDASVRALLVLKRITPRLVYTLPVVIVGAGELNLETLDQFLAAAGDERCGAVDEASSTRHGERVAIVAVDGGMDAIAQARPHLAVDALVGDLDSVSDAAEWKAAGVRVVGLTEQDTTDCHKVLRVVHAPLALMVGFEGRRVDHLLAALSAVASAEQRAVMAVGTDLAFRLPAADSGESFAIDLPPTTRFSLFPLGHVAGLVSTGLQWPLDGIVFAPAGMLGTSNAVVAGSDSVGTLAQDDGQAVTVRITATEATGPMLVILGLAHLDAAMSLCNRPHSTTMLSLSDAASANSSDADANVDEYDNARSDDMQSDSGSGKDKRKRMRKGKNKSKRGQEQKQKHARDADADAEAGDRRSVPHVPSAMAADPAAMAAKPIAASAFVMVEPAAVAAAAASTASDASSSDESTSSEKPPRKRTRKSVTSRRTSDAATAQAHMHLLSEIAGPYFGDCGLVPGVEIAPAQSQGGERPRVIGLSQFHIAPHLVPNLSVPFTLEFSASYPSGQPAFSYRISTHPAAHPAP